MADMTLTVSDSVNVSEGCSHPDIARSVSDSVHPSGIIWRYGDVVTLKSISDSAITVVQSEAVGFERPESLSDGLSASDNLPVKSLVNPVDSGESLSFADQKNNMVLDGKASSESVTVSSLMRDTASLSILTPSDQSSFLCRDSITFTATAVNLLTSADMDDSIVKWSSTIDGVIGYGKTFNYSMLSVGVHSISVTATGHVGARSITVTIVDDSAPGRPENLDEE